MYTRRFITWFLIVLCCVGIGFASKEEGQTDKESVEQRGAAQGGQEEPGEPNLAQQARNPTASLTQFQVLVNHTSSFHNLDDADMTSLTLMPVIPFKLANIPHIMRVTLPFMLSSPDISAVAKEDQSNALPPNFVPTAEVNGLGDTALFDLMIFPAPWKGGRIAGGISAMLPTATDPALGTGKWSLGPALGGLVQAGKFLGGGIFLSNFSVAGKKDRDDVRLMTIQPFSSYGLGNGWSVETSMMNFNRDFETGSWTTIPLGGRIGKMVTFGKQPVRLFAEVEYNFADSSVAPRWTFRIAVVPLI